MESDPQIRFTHHALLRCHQREINQRNIYNTIKNPSRRLVTEQCVNGVFKYRFEKDYKIRKLVVIANIQTASILVITAYWAALNA
ncbi:MAG: DUF4258 domain-containing protein [Opitutales bacterium]